MAAVAECVGTCRAALKARAADGEGWVLCTAARRPAGDAALDEHPAVIPPPRVVVYDEPPSAAELAKARAKAEAEAKAAADAKAAAEAKERAEAEARAAAEAKALRRASKIDDKVAEKVQKRLKNAVKGRATIDDVLKKHDKSGDGRLDAKELKTLVRKDLKLGVKDVSEKDIAALVAALDDPAPPIYQLHVSLAWQHAVASGWIEPLPGDVCGDCELCLGRYT